MKNFIKLLLCFLIAFAPATAGARTYSGGMGSDATYNFGDNADNRTIAERLQDHRRLEDYGVVIDDPGAATANVANFQKLISDLPTTGAEIRLPRGVVYLDAKITVADKSIAITGAGNGVSALNWVSTSITTGLDIIQTGTSYTTVLNGFEMETNVLGTSPNPAITVDYCGIIINWDSGQTGNPSVSTITDPIWISDIDIRPQQDLVTNNHWVGGILLRCGLNQRIENISFRGGTTGSNWPNIPVGYVFPSKYGIKNEGIPPTMALPGSLSLDTGVATGTQTTLTLQDTSKTWTANAYKGKLVKITGGTGSGQIRRVASNSTNTLTLAGALAWQTSPIQASSSYTIMDGYIDIATGTVDSSTANTLTDSQLQTDGWTTNGLTGRVVCLTSGTDSGECRRIVSNTSTTLTLEKDWYNNPTTNAYNIRDPNATAPDCSAARISKFTVTNAEHGIWGDRINQEGHYYIENDLVWVNYGVKLDFVEPNGNIVIVDSHMNGFEDIWLRNAKAIFISRNDLMLSNYAPTAGATIYLEDGLYDSMGLFEGGAKITDNNIRNASQSTTVNPNGVAHTGVHLGNNSGGATIDNNIFYVESGPQPAGIAILIDSGVNHAVVGENTFNVESSTNDTSTYVVDNSGDTTYKFSTNFLSAPTDNELYAYDGASEKWINQTASEAGLATVTYVDTELTTRQLTDNTDVNTSTPTDGNFLRAAGVDWESSPILLSDLPVDFLDQYNEATGAIEIANVAIPNAFSFTKTLASVPDGFFHIFNGNPGVVDANASFDDLVIEAASGGGISILSTDTSTSGIAFGSPANSNVGGRVTFNHSTTTMSLLAPAVTGVVEQMVGGVTITEATPTGFEMMLQAKSRTHTFATEYDNTTGSTISWEQGQKQKSSPTGAITYIFNPPVSGVGTFQLKLVNGGAATITWPGSVIWAGGYEPTWTTAGTDLLSFYYDGSTYYGAATLGF